MAAQGGTRVHVDYTELVSRFGLNNNVLSQREFESNWLGFILAKNTTSPTLKLCGDKIIAWCHGSLSISLDTSCILIDGRDQVPILLYLS